VRLIVNGEKHDIDATTLAGALRALEYGEAKLATALNGEFVPARARAATPVNEGDRIEILAPRQGG
jgi:sulfur carrier protein